MARRKTVSKPATANAAPEANKPEEKKVKVKFGTKVMNFFKSPKTRKAVRIGKAIAEGVILVGAGAELINGRSKRSKYGIVPTNQEPDLLEAASEATAEPEIHTETADVDESTEVTNF